MLFRSNIWVANLNGVTKLRASDGSILFLNLNGGGLGVAFDGANIWVANNGTNTVSKY